MAKLVALSSLTLSLLILLFISGGEAQRTWCIADPHANPHKLQQNIDYCCAKVDCSIIRPGGSCFDPNTVADHASVVMNLFYQQTGRVMGYCSFGRTGLITNTDPSHGSCKFPSL